MNKKLGMVMVCVGLVMWIITVDWVGDWIESSMRKCDFTRINRIIRIIQDIIIPVGFVKLLLTFSLACLPSSPRSLRCFWSDIMCFSPFILGGGLKDG
ncbi:hypothetical protein [Candidatus Liberibacter solanacearum]|uniref:hypothetical protein n=1 Tax=Candidatus Liberibacter solanacearum TaxID=556287 RepID=UPI00128F46BD|nr:hypothetical protein [Candidatus Liberibacter solanacearum]